MLHLPINDNFETILDNSNTESLSEDTIIELVNGYNIINPENLFISKIDVTTPIDIPITCCLCEILLYIENVNFCDTCDKCFYNMKILYKLGITEHTLLSSSIKSLREGVKLINSSFKSRYKTDIIQHLRTQFRPVNMLFSRRFSIYSNELIDILVHTGITKYNVNALSTDYGIILDEKFIYITLTVCRDVNNDLVVNWMNIHSTNNKIKFIKSLRIAPLQTDVESYKLYSSILGKTIGSLLNKSSNSILKYMNEILKDVQYIKYTTKEICNILFVTNT